LTLKAGFYKNIESGQTGFDDAPYYLYLDAPESVLEWDLQKPMTGYSLGFAYPTYFTRFFKKEVALTPTAFCNQ